jgi:programmed cell death protein 4
MFEGKKITRQNSKEGVLGVAGAPNFIAPHRRWKNSRRSRNGVGRGLPKKGGAGGKGVWGKLGSELLEEIEDQDDPNFDSEAYDNQRDVELKEVVPELTLEEFTQKTELVLLEYYENGDTHEVAVYLDEFLTGSLRPMIIKVAVEKAMEHKQSHREMTSVLISDLYGKVVTSKDISRGFDALLSNLSDIVLDTPDAAHILGNFIARAVADDCIPPKYVTHPEIDMEDVTDHAVQAIKRADTLLSMQHTWAHLDNVWGVSGGLRPVKNITRQMKMLLQEYLESRDTEEAHRCLLALEVPHFYHELIYEAVIITLEAMNEGKEEAMCALLKSLDKACIVTRTQLEQVSEKIKYFGPTLVFT